MISFQNWLIVVVVLFSGLVAGLLYSYSCSVNPGLKLLPDPEYLRAMQSINLSIQNPYFFISFMGLLLLFPIACKLSYTPHPGESFYFLLAASALYFLGVFGVTIFGNVPLNNQLASFNISSAPPLDLATMRQKFEPNWNSFHLIRTLASTFSFLLVILSFSKFKR